MSTRRGKIIENEREDARWRRDASECAPLDCFIKMVKFILANVTQGDAWIVSMRSNRELVGHVTCVLGVKRCNLWQQSSRNERETCRFN